MILLLELDRIKQAASRSAAERAGLLLHAVDHEDQLAQVDLSAVNLVVVGRDWPEYLLNQLRASGLHCPCIYATSTAEHDSAYRIAKERGWVDVVTYPMLST
ncbi:hypothetical protein JZ785_04480 [Alicyclobacillus curvatus]|nr:hypothetical protein JZ785_04480 [Alicyclobacillus curvatus]